MRIVVLVKDVPDTYDERRLDLETGYADREAGQSVLDEIDERALELALTTAERLPDVEVAVLTMGPQAARPTVRKALATGADSAVHVVDDALAGADLALTAEVLAAALRHTGFDLVIAGDASTDGAGGAVPAMVAEHLDVPHLTALTTAQITAGAVSGTRAVAGGTAHVSAELPAVVSVTEAFPDARLPKLRGIMAAKKKPYRTLGLADLGVDPAGGDRARSVVVSVAERPARAAGVKIVDEGDAGEQLAEFLVANRLA